MPRLAIDDLQFHYSQSGAGPDVVLIHGLTGDLSIWLLIDLVRTLAADFRVTSYDLRGHGYSSVPPTGYTSADMAADLQRLHRALGLGPAYLVGHSFGAVIALHAALNYPDMVAGGILSDPYFPGLRELEVEGSKLVGGHEPDARGAEVWQRIRATCTDIGAQMPEGDDFDMGQILKQLAHLVPGTYGQLEVVFRRAGIELTELHWTDFGALLEQMNALPADRKEILVKEVRATQTQRVMRLAGTSCGPDIRASAGLTAATMTDIRQPLVALYGELSPFLATCRFLERTLPNCRVALVPGAKHLAPLENRAAFVQMVQQHLRELAGIECPFPVETAASAH